MTELIKLTEEVESALHAADPVVALETTLVSHGFPYPEGAEVALESERRVRAAGAVPATVGVVDGTVRVGLAKAELERFALAGQKARKVGPRDLAACAVQGALGATTVGGTLAACRLTGIRFMGTGGLGGVHRGFPRPPDVSADLAELARAQVLVVAAGVKSILDVPATAEVLETLGIPTLGWRTNELPLFYAARGGPVVSARVDTVEEAARVAQAHWRLDRHTALLLARPADEGLDDLEPLIEKAVAAAAERGVSGQAVTPFVLAYLHEHTGGRTVAVNKRLITENAGLAAEVAAAFSALL
ncbi:MAG: pseudouridine-5'-phosphate glycosidase [Candidatus Dormibacter sp.]|uniref:pseudouridine-5'-phosphate glycosidase n=1 Tax=Candidatus Dormibacter sp. TaxID=2973982 RepID=UPI000DB2B747|nr:MAG: pseudouridine-5-phosphate glycosidase [Candidatus Dormibacteraeota bacterium]